MDTNFNQIHYKRYNEFIPFLVQKLEASLLEVLNEHYYVQGQFFYEISANNMAKHEICHLTKALRKIQAFFDEYSSDAKTIIINEVIPDLIIYALECAIKYDVKWWESIIDKDLPQNEGLLNYLVEKYSIDVKSEYELLNYIRNSLIISVSKLGDFCDKSDHNSVANVNLENEVIIPFLKSAFQMSEYFKINLDSLFLTRLIFVRNKYVGQPNFYRSI